MTSMIELAKRVYTGSLLISYGESDKVTQHQQSKAKELGCH